MTVARALRARYRDGVSTVAKPEPGASTITTSADDAVARSIDNAPIDAQALTAEELAELEARFSRLIGSTSSTADVLAEIAERARRGE